DRGRRRRSPATPVAMQRCCSRTAESLRRGDRHQPRYGHRRLRLLPRHDSQPWISPVAVMRAPPDSGRRETSSERNEQQEQRDQQREDAERFGHGEAEDQVAELALGCRRIAYCCGEIVAKMTPTPTPAPPMPMHAMPAPISLAAAGSIFDSLRERRVKGGKFPGPLSVPDEWRR